MTTTITEVLSGLQWAFKLPRATRNALPIELNNLTALIHPIMSDLSSLSLLYLDIKVWYTRFFITRAFWPPLLNSFPLMYGSHVFIHFIFPALEAPPLISPSRMFRTVASNLWAKVLNLLGCVNIFVVPLEVGLAAKGDIVATWIEALEFARASNFSNRWVSEVFRRHLRWSIEKGLWVRERSRSVGTNSVWCEGITFHIVI